MGLFDAAMGMRLRNSTYRAVHEEMGDEITEATATRDLRQMLDAGLIDAQGEKRERYYVKAEPLIPVRREVIALRDPDMFLDPFST